MIPQNRSRTLLRRFSWRTSRRKKSNACSRTTRRPPARTGAARPRSSRIRWRHQLLHARQQEHKVHAHAPLARAATHRRYVVITLREQHLQVTVITRVRLADPTRDEGAHRAHLRQERRFVPHEGWHVSQQRRFRTEGRQADGTQPQCLEDLEPQRWRAGANCAPSTSMASRNASQLLRGIAPSQA